VTYFVRTATERDLPAIRALLLCAYEDTYVPIHGEDKVAELNRDWNSETVLRSCLKDPAGEFLVADNGKQIGGIAYATPAKSKPKTIGLVKLYVAPGLKRQGIGQSLLEEVEQCFPAAEWLRLQVDIENTGAIAFYQANGFVTVDRTENCGTGASGIPAFIMDKPLGQ
jgi:ribosomal protein S18 acetylase RimI-like enzyme